MAKKKKIRPNSKSRIKNSKLSLSSICWLLEAGRWKLNLNQTNPIVNNLKHDNFLFHSLLLESGRRPLTKTNPILMCQKIVSHISFSWLTARGLGEMGHILSHGLTPRGYNIAPPAEAFRLTIFDGLKPILRTAILPFQGEEEQDVISKFPFEPGCRLIYRMSRFLPAHNTGWRC